MDKYTKTRIKARIWKLFWSALVLALLLWLGLKIFRWIGPWREAVGSAI
jgi:hypothetical protein